MKFTSEFIEKVQEANNLVDIISQYTVLKPAAGGYMGRCPFPDHQEKTPSFSVSESKQVYNCFGCHKKGNIFTFLQQYSGQSFPEAVEYLAQRARIPLPEESTENTPQRNIREKKKAIFEVNRMAHDLFRHQLRLGKSFLQDYLKKRGISQETVDTFEMGYASENWDFLSLELAKKKFIGQFPILNLAEEARLIKARKDGGTYFDIFRDRLMFPIHLPSGEIVGFGGRVVLQGEPKYLNSPETMVFTKGKILYGLYQTAKHIRSEDQALIVEGYMDLIALYQAGFRNGVASMGTAVTLDQAIVISKMTKNVVALFDGDSAGQEAMERSLPLFFQAGLHPKGVLLPDNMDPDDFIKQRGKENFSQILNEAHDLFLVVLDKWMENFSGAPSEKVRICDLARPVLGAIPDPRLRSLYCTEMALKLGVPESWVIQSLEESAAGAGRKIVKPAMEKAFTASALQSSPSRPQILERAGKLQGKEGEAKTSAEMPLEVFESGSDSVQKAQKKVSLKGAEPAELQILQSALKSRANFSFILSENPFEFITHPVVCRVLERARDVYGQDMEKFDKLPGLLMNFIENPELLFGSALLEKSEKVRTGDFQEGEMNESSNQDFEQKLMRDAIRKLKESNLKMQLRKVKEQLKSSPSEESIQKLSEIQKHINLLKHGV